MILGAFGALASCALCHVVTVLPLSWITLYSKQSITEFSRRADHRGFLGAGGVVVSG